jgi:hypothetical protein
VLWTNLLSSTLQMETAISSRSLGDTSNIVQHINKVDQELNLHCHENLKSHREVLLNTTPLTFSDLGL